MSDVDLPEASAIRVPLRDRQPVKDEPKGPVVTTEEAEPDIGDPEAAVTDIARSLERVTAENIANSERARVAEQNERRARDQLAHTQKQTAVSRKTLAAANVETAKTALEAAKRALKSAREAGDVDAETTALGEIARYGTRLENAEADMAVIGADPGSAAGDMIEPVAQQQSNLSERSRAWIQAHPRFDPKSAAFDAAYHRDMLAEHYRLVEQDKVAEGSDAYFARLDAKAAELAQGDQPMRQQQRPNNFSGARPSNTAAQNGNTTKVPVSFPSENGSRRTELTVIRKANGDATIKVQPGDVAELKHWAGVNNMKYEEYVQELVTINQEQAEGRPTGLVVTDEGATYR